MKMLGIIGGLSSESTASYYKKINDLVRERLGGHHSAKLIVWSFDFAEFCALKEKGDWETQSKMLCYAAVQLKEAGADLVLIATNTMHKIAGDVQKALGDVPLIHIADATAEVAIQKGFKKVAFLGTKYSMEMDFYTGRLKEKGLEPLIPETAEEINGINDIIFNELTKNIITKESEEFYIRVIEGMKKRGAEAVILGCTEIGMLINTENRPLPVLDTTEIHAQCAVDLMLA